jgi:hypothetical protein
MNKRKMLAIIAVFAVWAVAIAWFSFATVALRKSFDAVEPWETVKLFLMVTAGLMVPTALLLLREKQ